MSFSKQIWDQLKNKTADEIISALKRDGAVLDATRGSARVFRMLMVEWWLFITTRTRHTDRIC